MFAKYCISNGPGNEPWNSRDWNVIELKHVSSVILLLPHVTFEEMQEAKLGVAEASFLSFQTVIVYKQWLDSLSPFSSEGKISEKKEA